MLALYLYPLRIHAVFFGFVFCSVGFGVAIARHSINRYNHEQMAFIASTATGIEVAEVSHCVAKCCRMKTKQRGGAISEDDCSDETLRLKELRMAARATIELFGNGAVAKTKERLEEVENEGAAEAASYWRALLEEVTRLHGLRHKF